MKDRQGECLGKILRLYRVWKLYKQRLLEKGEQVFFRVNDFGVGNEASKSQTHHLYYEGKTIAFDK